MNRSVLYLSGINCHRIAAQDRTWHSRINTQVGQVKGFRESTIHWEAILTWEKQAEQIRTRCSKGKFYFWNMEINYIIDANRQTPSGLFRLN